MAQLTAVQIQAINSPEEIKALITDYILNDNPEVSKLAHYNLTKMLLSDLLNEVNNNPLFYKYVFYDILETGLHDFYLVLLLKRSYEIYIENSLNIGQTANNNLITLLNEALQQVEQIKY